MNKIFALIALLALTPAIQADPDCQSALATILYVRELQQQVSHAISYNSYLEKLYADTFFKCAHKTSKDTLYQWNKKYAQDQHELMAQNVPIYASDFLPNVPTWDTIVAELKKRESRK